MTALHLSLGDLQAGLNEIGGSPADAGTVALIVRRPSVGARETLDEARLDVDDGLIGDDWHRRESPLTPDGTPHPLMQVTLVNARAIALIAGEPDRWALAGDQLYVDLDLGSANLPAGSRLRVGDAVLEVTGQPHRGCRKFSARFGLDALRFVNSPVGLEMRLRGMNARVVISGSVRRGDLVTKLDQAPAVRPSTH